METTTTHKFVFSILTEADTTMPFTIPDVKEDADAEAASTAMDSIIGLDVLQDEAGNKASVVETCDKVTTTTQRMF